MTAGAIEDFFRAWGAPADRCDALVRGAVATDVTYVDPRGEVAGPDALCAYVARFAASGPGAAAEVTQSEGEGRTRDVRVRFHGDGWEQFGRYRITLDDRGRIARAEGVPDASG